MTVIELLFSVDRKELLDRWNELYSNDFDDDEQGMGYIAQVLVTLSESVGVKTDMKVMVETNAARWKELGKANEPWMTDERGERVEVSGIHENPVDELDYKGDPYPADTRWALGFTSWAEWREMPVIQNPHDATMDPVTLAAHVIEELTWHGLPQAMEERRDELMDRVEEFHRATETGDMSGFTTLDEFLDEFKDE